MVFTLVIAGLYLSVFGNPMPSGNYYTNSLGMKLVRVESGKFMMGFEGEPLPEGLLIPEGKLSQDTVFVNGDYDEHPRHKVKLSKPFYMGVYEVTNAQYELFNPDHRRLRGKLGFSKSDDEAVVFVSWYQAKAFCDWLSEKEGRTYRLPTEAEWEYSCRAGTDTPYYTGLTLPEAYHNNVIRSWYPDPRTTLEINDPKWVNRKELEIPSLRVGRTPANRWGLYDMHGNVEEWCGDWYGPYGSGYQRDPVGMVTGDFRVTRGGSHSTELYYLRSANRMGALPEDKSWYIGFRVVLGREIGTRGLDEPGPAVHQMNVADKPSSKIAGLDMSKPYFSGPRVYVKILADSHGPLFTNHNHDPGIVECPNGDLLAIWYTCEEEDGRDLAVAASRLRFGSKKWQPASPFWDAPDRNDHCPGVWFDGEKTIYHFNGMSAAATWGSLAIIMRKSDDSGETWSRARLIVPEHGYRQMVGEPAFRTSKGAIVFGADAIYGSTVYISYDDGLTWAEPGGTLNGIHAGVVEMRNGRLMALGRGMNIDGMMPMSISSDMGKSWDVSASPLPALIGGQRMALMRLKQGPLFLASFTDEFTITDITGNKRKCSGLYGTLSYDDGKTWSAKRLITDDGPGRKLDGGAWTDEFIMSYEKAEPKGYMSVCQTTDGVIQLISSAQHYSFNQKWLETPPPAAPK